MRSTRSAGVAALQQRDEGGCSWRQIRDCCCGSSCCIEDSDDERTAAAFRSSTSGEWETRHIRVSATAMRRGIPVEIQSTTLIYGERAVEPRVESRLHFFQRLWVRARTSIRRWSSVRESSATFGLGPMRTIKINEKQDTKFASNHTTTAKYTVYTFVPIFLYEQFRRYSNLFFLTMAILQQIPGISPTGRYITLFPLLFILTVSAIKEIIEDIKRHRADNEHNHRKVELLKNEKWATVTWEEVCVGDIVRITKRMYFPADLLLLASSKPQGMCFIETANLDGETNLKVKQAVAETADLVSVEQLSNLKGTVECEAPNRRIYDFIGLLQLTSLSEPIALGPNQFLQRGAALSSTEWIYGFVIYTGHETKLMKNYINAPLKNSSVDRLLNKQIITLFGLFLFISIASAVLHFTWRAGNYQTHSYLNIEDAFAVKDLVFNMLTFFILYNNMIPISLQVTLEMVRFCQAIFINSDIEMYHSESDTCALARTSNLNEELGMVKYVLTDKTGTLTCNIMTFKKCSIGGIIYEVAETPEKSELVRNLREKHATAHVIEEFMLAITLCHAVVTELKEDGSIAYHATNPDDAAIIEGARRYGYEFLERTGDYIDIVRLGNRERYTVLQIIDFTSDRKRMSVLVREPSGKIKLYCKGADSVILERIWPPAESEIYNVTKDHLNLLAAFGYRTLCCAVRNIEEQEYLDWSHEYQAAATALIARDENIDRVADNIERNLTLLGITAIEDKLQEGVPETIKAIIAADIRVWMLTGDKQETAINIGFSSGLLHHMMRLVLLNEDNTRDTFTALRSHVMDLYQLRNVALVIDGKTLQYAMSSRLKRLFYEICIRCRVVICCRLSPMQKGDITDLVNSSGACTLAIGDGANDVTMIRKAKVGVGISGTEGLQAACASDYSIAQFRYLRRLLFVHGTWNYRRITTLILYAFYKNICMCIIQLWFCIYNGWSAQILFESWSIAGYNVLFTAVPPMIIGILDKVCNAETLLRNVRVYRRAHDGKLFNVWIFWIWIINAFIHSIILFWLPLAAFYATDPVWEHGINLDLIVHGNIVYTVVIVTVCLKAGITIHSWSWVTHLAIWGSIASWFIWITVYSYFWPVIPMGASIAGLNAMLFTSITFWLLVLLIPPMTLLPDFFFKVIYNTYFTTITEAVRNTEKERTAPRA